MLVTGWVSGVEVDEKTKGDKSYKNVWVTLESSFRFKLASGVSSPVKGGRFVFEISHEWVRPADGVHKPFVIYTAVGFVPASAS